MTKAISSCELSPQSTIPPDLISSQCQNPDEKVNKSTNESVAQSKVPALTEELQIVHATNGRIRIRTTDASLNSKLEIISKHLRRGKGVKEASVNQQTGSLVVTFDENLISLPQMLEILHKLDIQQSQTPLQSVDNIDPFAAWKSFDFWKEQTVSLIPLMTGLAVTTGLKINGFVAIPVYMITSSATRRVIDYLEPQVSASESSKSSHTNSVTKSSQSSSSTSDDRLSEIPQPAKVDYKVAHAIPGRMRFHIPQLAQDRAYAERLERLIKTDPQVNSVRINYDAASIAIAYQPREVSVTHWVNLIELALEKNPPTPLVKTVDQQLPVESVSQPAQAIDTTTTSEPENQAIDLSSVWADMKSPGLSFSLDYMANLCF
ncbi:hypothetical protein I8751_19080 [Nostocaceae cyanobacterium CENA357]|uniref:HMA domain-containing protein n=1 Tax=Atlanticothrix silvestris CENA357 TaxID=1725252 RepID=A0A8J7HG98_9CYAN|nr:hypothetical protein [Atlanticothrix silvestris]MBH8554431.1 hypothetical protein [Atlanticothrix silvestris CENA357]